MLVIDKSLPMNEDPIRDENGELLCPKCHIPLVEGKTPFYFKMQYIGKFDAIVCRLCHYSLLTPSGYDKAMEMTRSFGLIGSPEIMGEVIEERQEEGVTQYGMASLFQYANLQKDSAKNNKVESEDSNEQTIVPSGYENVSYSKKQILLLKTQ